MKNKRIAEIRPTDYIKGVSSPIPFKAVTSGDWTPHIQFFEPQRLLDGDTDDCEFYTQQESFDCQMDVQLQSAPQSIIAQLTLLGFMDTASDGSMRFHSTPRFLGVMSGVGQNGTSMTNVWQLARTYGMLGWKDLPVKQDMTLSEYFAPISDQLKAKSLQLLALLGGKNTIQYHWLWQNKVADLKALQTALQQAPICFGIAVTDGWNQIMPTDPPASQAPQHAVMCYKWDAKGCWILDHYIPYEKILDGTYPILYALQGIITPSWQVAQEVTQVVQTAEEIIPQVPPTQQSSILTAIQSLLITFLKWIQN